MKNQILYLNFLLLLLISCSKIEKANLDNSSLTSDEVTNKETIDRISIPLDTITTKFSSEQLDNTKGLSNSSVNTIFQDSQNLIWIGGWDGLNRYDGNNFKIFRPELNNENSLSNQVILKIDEDAAGAIWVVTMHGINRYDKRTDSFQRFYFQRKNTPPLSESEFNIALNQSKNVFCAVKDWGIGYYNGSDFIALKSQNLPKKAVRKMEFTNKGTLVLLYEDNEL